MAKDQTFVLVQIDMLSEVVQRTLQAKKRLETGEATTIQEAVDQVGISRSSFYKYKDQVFPFHTKQNKMITISMILEHRSGVLSSVLGFLADQGANVLTINQTIPLQGKATVSMSVDIVHVIENVNQVLERLQELDGVSRAVIIGSGE